MPGMLLLGTPRVSFQPGVDPFGLQPNGSPASDAHVAQFLALAGRVDGVPAQAGVLRALRNAQTLLTRRRVTRFTLAVPFSRLARRDSDAQVEQAPSGMP